MSDNSFYYAQLNGANIVCAVSQLKYQVFNSKMIPIPSYDPSLIGLKYDAQTGQFYPPIPVVDVFVHGGISGGDGKVPPGIKNNGIDAVNVDAWLRWSPSPSSPLFPWTGEWRVILRGAGGNVQDQIILNFVGGECHRTYSTTTAPDIYSVMEEDFLPEIVGGVMYNFRLANSHQIPVVKVYRD